MLRTAICFVLLALIASAGSAQARIRVIYPPQSYQAPFKFCPHFWDELYSCGCHGHGGYHRYRPGHGVQQVAPVGVTQVNVQVVRSRRASTVVVVAPGIPYLH